jgi:hypothetical protein
MFGVIEHDQDGSSAVRLTPLGQMIVDASRQREARVKAFLSYQSRFTASYMTITEGKFFRLPRH